ncbi:MAG: 3-isopropylmalate dehydratase small subunit, partial [Deferribacterota bacterium]|nr:3-isopropylmalate dehydratase small subunit [Deferribacterota bacterium]
MFNIIKEIKCVEGKPIVIPYDNIDTDRIIPARFMKTTTFEKLGEYCFYDERFSNDGKPLDHPFNKVDKSSDYILITRKNFGCGSSREHAPQSLKRAGVKAVIAESFAEIFYGNATTIGLPCIVLNKSEIDRLINLPKDSADNIIIRLDIENKVLEVKSLDHSNVEKYNFELPEDIRLAFIKGIYDNISLLAEDLSAIKDFEKRIPYSF